MKMEIISDQNNLLLRHVPCLDIGLTLDCGQAFRWSPCGDGKWHGVALGKALTLEQSGDCIILYDTTLETYQKNWKKYFDFDRDYDRILKCFMTDALLGETVQAYYGIRVLRQDSWEALFSFVFSSSNNIKRIRGFLEKLAARYGTELGNGDYAFPTSEQMAKVSEKALREMGAGYRAPYLVDCARQVASGTVDLEALKQLPLEEAKAQLMRISGVGPKVAACALLFGFDHLEAFPVDRWIQRVLALYPNGLPACFQGYEGIAQQYMFHYARMHLGAK